MVKRAVTFVTFATLLCCALFSSPRAASSASGSLFERLGGMPALKNVVEQFVSNCATDDRIKTFFAATAANPTRLTRLKEQLVDQICEAAGGPCNYTGKTMREAHAGMEIKAEHFDAALEDLEKALTTVGVSSTERKELLDLIRPLKAEIVTPSAPPLVTIG